MSEIVQLQMQMYTSLIFDVTAVEQVAPSKNITC